MNKYTILSTSRNDPIYERISFLCAIECIDCSTYYHVQDSIFLTPKRLDATGSMAKWCVCLLRYYSESVIAVTG